MIQVQLKQLAPKASYFLILLYLLWCQVPLAMDILIAELNKACIYTVPKHISYSQVINISFTYSFLVF